MKKIGISFLLIAMAIIFSSSGNDDEVGDCLATKGSRKSAGPNGCYSNEPPLNITCAVSGCHTDFSLNSGIAKLNLYLGGAESGYVPGQNYTITVSLAKTGILRGGFQIIALKDNDISTSPGTVTLTDAVRMQLIDAAHPHGGPCSTLNKTWVQHTADGIDNVSGDSITWQYNWQAPASYDGSFTFYLTAVEADKDLESTGDHVYALNKTSFGPATGINDAGMDGSIVVYPVPFADKIMVQFKEKSEYQYSLIDIAGKVVANGATSSDQLIISTSSLSVGSYVLELKSENTTIRKKVLKIF